MGLIHLYSATSTSFDNNGTPLVTAREAVVKRDEGFQLTFSIPISQNDLHKRVQKEMIVSAMTPDGVNYFRIWDIEKRTTDVKVTALQLLYSLDVKQINPFGGRQYTGDSVLEAFANSFKSPISPYTFSSSILTLKDFHTNEEDDTSTSHNALAILNKITDNWSGELMLNGFDVRMISKLGTKTDALLYEHKNIASFSDSSSMNGIVTRIYATATYTPERDEGATEDPEPVVLTATVDSPLINQYAIIYEATAEYNDARTVAELRTEILKQYSEFNVDKPERTIDVDTNIVDGTAINFGDELVLKYLVHDVDEIIRCVGYEYDPISENYVGVTLGTLEKTFLTKVTEGISSSVTRQLDQLNKQIQGVQTAANGKNRITYGPNPVPNAIEGDLWFYHPEGRPDEVEIRVYQNGLWMPAPFLTDQDRADFDQAMTDHYNDALAEIERKDAEYKEIFDDYDEKVVTIDQEIADAATKAQSALEEAGISTDLAQTAKDLAATAQANASTAITDASQAKEDALKAVTDASQAKEDAQTAITEAGQAVDSANTAKTNAQTALDDASTAKTNAQTAIDDAQTAITNASQAKTDASTALTQAGQAITSSNTATTNAQTALDNSNTAITNAADAITKAGQAEDIANTAKTNAQTALDDAQSALTEAGNAKTTANTLSTKVDDLEGEVELKASQTEVDGISGTVSTHATTIGQHATAIASKAESSLVNAIKGTVDTHTTEISQNATDIASKASSSSVNTLTGRVDTAESNISQNATAITQRVTTTTYNTGIASKENSVLKQTTAPTHLNGRLWLDTSVTPNVLKRSNGTTWIKATPTTPGEVGAYSQSDGAGLAGRLTTAETSITQTATAITSKADKSTVDTLVGTVSTQGTTIAQHADLIESKANQTEVDTVKGTVSGHTTTISQHATAIASKAESSLVNTIKGTVDTHTTEISQNATDIASKASSSSVNTLTGRVDTAESNITQNATAITQRVTTATYNSGIASKENTVLKQTTAPTHLNGRLWLDTSATPNILKRSTGTAWVKATPTTPGEVGAYSQSAGAGLAGRLTTAETSITQTSTAITSKADKSIVDTLAGTVGTQGTTIAQHATAIESKAEQTEVDTVKGTVSGHTTTLSQHATAIASKAESSLVNTIKGTVDTHTTDISQNATDIASKASSSSVNTLTGRVNTAESNISQNATAITQRVTTTTYNTGLGTKENSVLKQSAAPAHLNGRLWLDTSVTPNVLKRSTGSAWVKATPTTAAEVGAYSSSQGSTLAGRVTTAETNISQTSTAITSKADKSVVDTLSGTVSTHGTTLTQHATAISSKAAQTEVDTVKGTVSGHTTLISQNATAISARLTSAQVNSLVDGKGLATSTYVNNQITATATGIRTDLTKVEGKIDNLQIGGTNLYPNSGYPYDVSQYHPVGTSWTVDGVRHVYWTGHITIALSQLNKDLVVGETYTFSFLAKASNDYVTSSNDIYINPQNRIPNTRFNYTTKWTKYSVSFKVNTSGSNVRIHLYPNVGPESHFYMADWKLEKGNIATDWSPAPEDTVMENDFNVFKASYEATAEALTSRLTAVDKVGGRLSTAETNISQNATAISSRLTSSQVNSLVDGKGFATQTWANNQITATANGINTNLTRVEGKIDGLQVGGRNLFVTTDTISGYNSNGSIVSSTEVHRIMNSLVDVSDTKSLIYQIWNPNKTINTSNSNRVAFFTEANVHISSIAMPYMNGSTYQMLKIEVPTNARKARLGVIMGASTIDPLIKIKIEKGNKATDWSPAPEDTMDYTNTQIDIKAGQVTTSLTSLINTKATPAQITSAILADKRIKDTRTTNETPAWYYANYPQQTVKEFKEVATMGIGSGTYGVLTTEVTWYNSSGGTVKQSFLDNDGVAHVRRGTSTAWSAWETTATSTYVNTTITQEAGRVEQLITQVKTSPTTTITGYNSLVNNVNSMVQAIGTTGGKIAQMVLTDSSFSTKVLSTVDVGGRNLLRHSDSFSYHTIAAGITASIETDNTRKFVTVSGNGNYASVGFSNTAEAEAAFKEGDDFTVSLTIKRTAGSGKPSLYIKPGMGYYELLGDLTSEWSTIYYTGKWKKANGISIHIGWAGTSGTFFIKNVKLEKGNVVTAWTPSPEDKASQTQVTQLANSWALTLKSGNDIKTQINASTDGIRLQSKFIHLNGSSLIDDATIKSAKIENLNANKIVGNTADFNTIRTGVLTADAVTSTHIKADTALFNTLFSTTSATDRLSARDAWIKNANIISINADKITAGTISAARISTSSLNNVELGGTNLYNGSSYPQRLADFYPVATATYGIGDGSLIKNCVYWTGAPYAALPALNKELVVGKTYTLSFYAKTNKNGVTSSSDIHVNSSNWIPNSKITYNYAWKRYKYTFTVKGSGTGVRVHLYPNLGSGDHFYLADFQLEEGSVMTAYSPAPEDDVTDLGRVTRRVEIHGGNIKADTLDVGAITGNKATFISTGFKSLNSQATVSGNAIRIQNSAGEFVEMNNTPELRSDDAGGTAVVLGKGRVHFYDSRGYSKGYVGTDMHTAGSYDFGTFLSKGSGIYKFARMADATQTTYAYYTIKAGITSPSGIITNMVQNGYLPDGNPQQFVAKGNMLSQLNGWPAYPNWPALSAGQQIRYKEVTSQTTGDAYEDIWKFGPSSNGDWRIYFAKHATFEGGTTGTSDRRLKHDIETTQVEALHHIESLAFKEFRWNRDNKYEPLGLIAQDSGIVRVADDDMEGIDIQRAIMLGLKGIQELQAVVKEQAAKIKQLEEINNQ